MSTYEQDRAVMDSFLAVAQEETFNGFDSSVQKDIFSGPHRRIFEVVYRMGFETGYRIARENEIRISGETPAGSGFLSAAAKTATDAEIQAWADRHRIDSSSMNELRCMFDDARTLVLGSPRGASGSHANPKALVSCCGQPPDVQQKGIGQDEYVEIECQCCNRQIRLPLGSPNAAAVWASVANGVPEMLKDRNADGSERPPGWPEFEDSHPEPLANSPAVEKAITRFHRRLAELRAWHCGRGCPSGDVCEVVKFGRPGACEGAYGVRERVMSPDSKGNGDVQR